MSYITLPKKIQKNIDNIIISTQEQLLQPIISFSLIHYLKLLNKQIENISLSLKQNINPYSFVYTNISSSNIAISKLNLDNDFFYSFAEIINTFYLSDIFINKNINILYCCSKNGSSSYVEYINSFSELNNHNKHEIQDLTVFEFINGEDTTLYTMDFGYFELMMCHDTNFNNYIIQFMHVLCYILLYQNNKGCSIIKINTLYHKPILDIVYLFTCMFENVHIIKPSVSNIFNEDRYVVCKNFSTSVYNPFLILKNMSRYNNTNNTNNTPISSLLNINLPYIFLNKIEDSNIMIGQMQLEYFNQLLSISKNKSVDEKIEVLKKNNIQKCIQWCEKMKIPHNKFIDKLNIFLPIVIDE